MDVTKKLNPGALGTKRFIAEFGDRLVCVRYRRDPDTSRRFTTIEIIVDEAPSPSSGNEIARQMFPHPNRNVFVRVSYQETELRLKLRTAGARWKKEMKLWQLPFHKAVSLGLKDRIEELD